jgi:hypothetical protein
MNNEPALKGEPSHKTEPVAHFYPEGEGCTVFSSNFALKYQGTKEPIPLYTHPANLTDEEIDMLAHEYNCIDDYPHEFVRACIRKAQEK